MSAVWDKIKILCGKSWPYIWGVLRILPKWLFTTKTGLLFLAWLLARLGIPQQLIEGLSEIFKLAIDQGTLVNVNSIIQDGSAIGGTFFANEDKKYVKSSWNEVMTKPVETPEFLKNAWAKIVRNPPPN